MSKTTRVPNWILKESRDWTTERESELQRKIICILYRNLKIGPDGILKQSRDWIKKPKKKKN